MERERERERERARERERERSSRSSSFIDSFSPHRVSGVVAEAAAVVSIFFQERESGDERDFDVGEKKDLKAKRSYLEHQPGFWCMEGEEEDRSSSSRMRRKR